VAGDFQGGHWVDHNGILLWLCSRSEQRIVGHHGDGQVPPNLVLVMPTATRAVGYQHTLTKMILICSRQASIIICRKCWHVQVSRSHCLMVGHRVVFREVISAIGDTGAPKYVELALTSAVTKPVKVHANGF